MVQVRTHLDMRPVYQEWCDVSIGQEEGAVNYEQAFLVITPHGWGSGYQY
jgi:hypothetical protein